MNDTQLPIEIDSGDEPLSNHSGNPHFNSVLDARLSRRDVLKGGLGAAMLGLFGASAALANPASLPEAAGLRPPFMRKPMLGFDPIAVTRADAITVPAGYTAKAFVPWGTPITGSYPAYIDGGHNTGADQEQQVGMHHDGMHYYPAWPWQEEPPSTGCWC
jgi:uncharacterized protein